jgi:hypothetical protein
METAAGLPDNFGSMLVVFERNGMWFIQGGSNMTRTDLCVNKLHYAAAVRP